MSPMYHRNGGPTETEDFVHLRVTRRLQNPSDIIAAESIKKDPILQDLLVLRMPKHTNYKLSQAQGERLVFLCTENFPSGNDGWIGPTPKDDPEQREQFARRIRFGQPAFRLMLLNLYEHRCAVTGWGPDAVLQAAHICSHSKSGNNAKENGILLRSDLHDLFDDGLLRIAPNRFSVVIHESLRETEYWHLRGTTLRPRVDGSQPSKKYLEELWSFWETSSPTTRQ